MRCPFCDAQAEARAMLEHLVDRHAEQVSTQQREEHHYYSVTCPLCQARYSHRVRKAARDPGFLVEFDRQIRMVALDMLVHHLVGEHELEQTGG